LEPHPLERAAIGDLEEEVEPVEVLLEGEAVLVGRPADLGAAGTGGVGTAPVAHDELVAPVGAFDPSSSPLGDLEGAPADAAGPLRGGEDVLERVGPVRG